MTDKNKVDFLKGVLGRVLVLEKDGDLVRDTLYPRERIIQRMNEDLAEESSLASMTGPEIEKVIRGDE